MTEAAPLTAEHEPHHHYYRSDIADWWCEECDTVTDYCVELNDFGQGASDER